MGESARLRLKVRHYEVDEYGHVNHANYVHYLEAGRVEALEAVGLPLREMRRQGVIIVAADLSVKYLSPASPGETLDIVTHIREMRGARTLWVQEIRVAGSERLVVTAEVTGAFMTEAGRPVRAPDSIRDRLSMLFVPGGGAIAEGSSVGSKRVVAEAHGRDASAQTWAAWCVCGSRGLGRALRQITRSR